MPALTNKLREEYQTMFDSCAIHEHRLEEIEMIVKKIEVNMASYNMIEAATDVPWFVVAVLHNMESGLNFNAHMHNGDPLNARTVQVPKGRPIEGIPPFTFTESAIDAMKHKKFHTHTSWLIPEILYRIELYNGFGYRKHKIFSPYLWSGSNHYTKGKYVADGAFSPTAVSKQIGAIVLLRRMAEKGLIQFQSDTLKDKEYLNLVRFDPVNYNPHAEELQHYLNTLPGIYLLPDGKAGRKTSAAFKKVFGVYLKGDPREVGG